VAAVAELGSVGTSYDAMSFFDRFRGDSGARSPESVDLSLRQRLVELVLGILREQGRIRVEDAISAAATIVAERCIDAAGDFALRDHELVPGSRVFSTKVNELICGDISDGVVGQVPKDSIVGVLRRRLDARVCADADFPALASLPAPSKAKAFLCRLSSTVGLWTMVLGAMFSGSKVPSGRSALS
jgi:hypothetical protein